MSGGRRGLVATLAGGAVGLAVGLVAERRLVHRRLVAPPAGGPRPVASDEEATVPGPGGLRLAVERHGPVGAPQLVLVHGWLCSTRVWDPVVARLRDELRLVAYDQPGHGRTPRPADGHYDLDLLGDALLAVVEGATAPGPVVLVGHSLGGMTVLNALRRHQARLAPRVAGTVLVSTTSTSRRDPAERRRLELGIRSFAGAQRVLRPLAGGLRRPGVIDVTARIAGTTSDLSTLITRLVGLGPDADAAIAAATTRMVLGAGPDPALGLLDAVLGIDEDAALELLPPSTAVVGTFDRLTPPALTRRMAARAGGRLEVIELARIGHLPPFEAPEALSAVLRARVDPAGSAAA
jgi:pimeloyl-ACP methyl ester carboxylesterase